MTTGIVQLFFEYMSALRLGQGSLIKTARWPFPVSCYLFPATCYPIRISEIYAPPHLDGPGAGSRCSWLTNVGDGGSCPIKGSAWRISENFVFGKRLMSSRWKRTD
jgi:hypothetical protein